MQPAPAHPVGAVPVLPVALEAQLAALAAALASGGSLRIGIGTGWVGRTGSLSLTLLSSRIGNGNGLGSLISTTRRLQRWKCAARLETCRAALSGQ